jgi:hypothetical protein
VRKFDNAHCAEQIDQADKTKKASGKAARYLPPFINVLLSNQYMSSAYEMYEYRTCGQGTTFMWGNRINGGKTEENAV